MLKDSITLPDLSSIEDIVSIRLGISVARINSELEKVDTLKEKIIDILKGLQSHVDLLKHPNYCLRKGDVFEIYSKSSYCSFERDIAIQMFRQNRLVLDEAKERFLSRLRETNYLYCDCEPSGEDEEYYFCI